MFSATLFLIAVFVWLAPVIASAQMLKPGEIVYSRAATVPGGSCETAAIWVVGQDGSNDRFITNGSHPRISPDGRTILFKRFHPSAACGPFGNTGAARWWIRELATKRETQISQPNLGISFGHYFSPETNRADRQIMFDDGTGICTMKLDGGNRACLFGAFGDLLPLRWAVHPSVRGQDSMVVVANYDNTSEGGLYTLTYDTLQDRVKVPNTTIVDLDPSWSPDGQTIAYATTNIGDRGLNGPFLNLFKINPDGSNKTPLTSLGQVSGQGFHHGLVWTLDNTTILNAATINGIAGIYKIAADGSGILGRIPITPGAPPEWVGSIVPAYSEQQVAAFGGGLTSGGGYSLVDTIGQAFAGQTSIGGSYGLQSGFWTIGASSRTTAFDYDGDGRADVCVFRPSQGSWYLQQSTAGFFGMHFGSDTDRIAPADYDGDGKTDIAVYRPSTGIWYITNSSNGTVTYYVFGIAEDLPTPADYDGDGKADVSVFRPSSGTWYRQNSSDNGFVAVQFGSNGDQPTIGDFDGDGRSDIAVFRPSNGAWYQAFSSNGTFFGEQFGIATDRTAPADYDGDGKTDIAIYRPFDGLWYVKNSATTTYTPYLFGLAMDIPVASDFDGDGKADIAVFRPSNGTWYIANSTNGSFTVYHFGLNGDTPTQRAFNN